MVQIVGYIQLYELKHSTNRLKCLNWLLYEMVTIKTKLTFDFENVENW